VGIPPQLLRDQRTSMRTPNVVRRSVFAYKSEAAATTWPH